MDIENQIPVAPTKVVVKRKSRIDRQELSPEEVGQIQRQRRSEINKKYYNRNSGKLRERERKRYKINKDINKQKEELINKVCNLLRSTTGRTESHSGSIVDNIKLRIEALKGAENL